MLRKYMQGDDRLVATDGIQGLRSVIYKISTDMNEGLLRQA